MTPLRYIILAILCTITGCSGGRPRMIEGERNPSKPIPADTVVYVLEPTIAITNMRNDQPIPVQPEKNQSRISIIDAHIQQTLGRSSLQPYPHTNELVAELAALGQAIQTYSKPLSQGWIPPEARPKLHELASRSKSYMLLFVIHLDIQIGPEGYWNSYSGEIRAESSKGYLSGSLVDCQTGEIRWQNAVIQREIEDPDQFPITQTIHMLLENFPNGRKDQNQ